MGLVGTQNLMNDLQQQVRGTNTARCSPGSAYALNGAAV
jgi:hypothetical protein